MPECVCRTCGQRFDVLPGRGHARAYCTPGCKPEKKPAIDTSRLCDVDGCSKHPRSSGSPWCETHYYRNRRQGSPLVTLVDFSHYDFCQHCGAGTQGQKFCSERCYARWRRGCVLDAECIECGKTFRPVQKASVCSDVCRERHRRTLHREYIRARMAVDGEFRARKSEQGARRRMLERNNGGRVERFDRLEIFERDGWRCQMCDKRVDRRLRHPHPMSASLDHIVPIAAGGEHSRRNVRLAHLRCNLSKCDRPHPSDQLLLVG